MYILKTASVAVYLVYGNSPHCPNNCYFFTEAKRKEGIFMTPENNISSTQITNINLDSLHGPLPIRMTNDYLFRAILQVNNFALKLLIASLLHLDIESIFSVEIRNPIELGKHIDEKTFFLDIKVELNNHTIINLELQVINEHNWTDRSLIYLCRIFDNLNKGDDYITIKPAIHIDLLDFTLFPEVPEFFATYYMINEKNHHRYSDKFRLSVLDLTQIKLATEEDRFFGINHWAELFKATTWEDLKMLTKSNSGFDEAAATIYHLSQDEQIREQCEAREDYYRRMNSIKRQFQEAKEQLDKAVSERNEAISERNQAISELNKATSESRRFKKILEEHGIDPN